MSSSGANTAMRAASDQRHCVPASTTANSVVITIVPATATP
jgi:hypothetical protein